jgi:hypothetical protein
MYNYGFNEPCDLAIVGPSVGKLSCLNESHFELVNLHFTSRKSHTFVYFCYLLLYQWEFQDPKMEVLYHRRPYFAGIFPYISLTYMVGTSNLGS